MKQHQRMAGRQGPARALAGASGLALILGLVNVAVGQTTSISVPAIATSDGDLVITQPGTGYADKEAQFNDAAAAATIDGKIVQVGKGTDAVTIANNAATATAGGNLIDSELTISSLTSQDFSLAGAQYNQGGTGNEITASVTGTSGGGDGFVITFTAPLSDATVSGNTVQAQATVNQSAIEASLDSLDAFGTGVAGSAAVQSAPAPQISASANGVIANAQRAVDSRGGSGSAATVTAAAITIDATDAGAGFAADGRIRVAGNTVDAHYGANDASLAFEGAGLDFEASSVVIANFQDNLDSPGAGAAPTASVSGSGVNVVLGKNKIDGNVTVARQQTLASSSGNAVDSTLALDTLRLSGDSLTTTASAVAAAAQPTAEVKDVNLGIASVQRNQDAHLESVIEGSDILVSGTGGDGRIVVAGNRSRAQSTGNSADNTITATAETFDGAGIAIANAQRNIRTDVAASNTTDMMVFGTPGSGTPTVPTALEQTAPVVLAANAIEAAAIGSEAGNQIVVGGASGAPAIADSTFRIANSQQANAGSVQADVTGDVAAILGSNDTDPVQATVARNRISSDARVNVASNLIDVDGEGQFVASVNNAQGVAAQQTAVAIATTEGGAWVVVGNDVGDESRITVNQNRIASRAGSNAADNAVRASSIESLEVAADGAALLRNTQTDSKGASATTLGWALIAPVGVLDGNSSVLDNVITSIAFGNSAQNTVALAAGTDLVINSDLEGALTNTQTSTGNVSADTTGHILIGPHALVPSAAPEIKGTATIKGNEISALALQNEAINALSLTAASGGISSGDALALVNTQTASGNTSANAHTDNGIVQYGMSITSTKAIDGTATIVDNVIASQATANQAVNSAQLSALGDITVGVAEIDSQQTNTGVVTADTTVAGLGIQAADDIAGKAILADNRLLAQARANDAVNLLGLESRAGGITAEATLGNAQTNEGDVSATLAVLDGVGIQAGGKLDGEAIISGNALSAQAVANAAINDVAASAHGDMAEASLTNTQTNSGIVIAELTMNGPFGIGMAGDLDAGSAAVVSGNTLDSSAAANQAQNRIALASEAGDVGTATLKSTQTNSGTVDSTLILGADGAGGLGIVAGGDISGTAVVNDNTLRSEALGNDVVNQLAMTALSEAGDGSLTNTQTNGGAITALLDVKEGIGVYTKARKLDSGTAVVSGNQLDSVAGGNRARNELSVATTTAGSGMDGNLENKQSNTATITSTVDFNTWASLGIRAASMETTTPTVADNAINARAYGNSAANILNASTSAGPLNLAMSGVNTQSNSGAVSATVNGPTSGIGAYDIVTLDGNWTGVDARMANNTVSAGAYGNVAYNQLTASSLLGMTTASQSLSSSQNNTGAVTASVNNAGMGIVAGGSKGGNTTYVANNSISATAVGNVSVSSMTIGN